MMTANSGIHLVKTPDIVSRARGVLLHEADEIRHLADRIGSAFEAAVHMLLACKGRVVVTGMGKSGHIGGKIAATLASTGTPAFFMHPAEASHGDLGMITAEDVVIALSNSGESDEIINILPAIRRIGARVLSITGSEDSTLSRESEVHLSAAVSHEACPLGLAPTASTTAALALGDALALCVLDLREFTAEDFARSHPGGSLGRRLLVRIRDVMRTGEAVPQIDQHASIQEAITQISLKGMGFTAIVDHAQRPIGIFTDGDLRRLFMQGKNNPQASIDTVMNKQPYLLETNQMAVEAVNMMEQHKINGFLAVDAQGQLVGAFNMHDLLKAKVV
ncbi:MULTISPECIES: KpsF/GutQ family sugar-phosphate isomerase [unclassified Methylophilus]|uniref:KpsF/GutQ family sugar-phosphate isomerase n=1 Tax=unclassified Methylophilus TaxID=2630143 RepID=UPI00188FE0EC|nr:KpsF/GutQ family sugar-phosphate isomerase [Methylophilus sp. 13]MBF5040618.1 KpsF/GutQ family sugar-phosphate isomerase [Methylophilus sp. 13]